MGQQQCDKNGYVKRYQGFPRTALGWAVTPEIMDYGLRFLQRRYGLPVYVTENGTACNDKIYGMTLMPAGRFWHSLICAAHSCKRYCTATAVVAELIDLPPDIY